MSMTLGPMPCRYVFLDVVAYSLRPVEAQTDVIASLNIIVKQAISELGLDSGASLLLPTGDGICVAIGQFESSAPPSSYDAHLDLAKLILKMIYSANEEQATESRKYSVRVGINENIDNVIIDVNERQNVAGAGINTSQRIMSAGDSSQILIGRSVYDVLHSREKYASQGFRELRLTTKHGEQIDVYQYLGTGTEPWLNQGVSAKFGISPESAPALNLKMASFIAEADLYRDRLLELVKRNDSTLRGATIALWLRSEDWQTLLASGPYEAATSFSDGFPDKDLLSYASGIAKLPFEIRWELDSFVQRSLERFSIYFEPAKDRFLFPTLSAVREAEELLSPYGEDPRKYRARLSKQRDATLAARLKALETIADAVSKIRPPDE